MKDRIISLVYDFFVKSNDFNGMPLRDISEILEIPYRESIDLIKVSVTEEDIMIQSSTNPHIIGFQHYPIETQLKILDDAKSITYTEQQFAGVTFVSEDTEYPICLYPTTSYLKQHRDLSEFRYAPYTEQLALATPHLQAIFFDIEVLDRYVNDPRFDFHFDDYSGRISCHSDEHGNALVREEDEIFIKTFGLGFDSDDNRVAVVYLRYLKDLTDEHQVFWKNKESKLSCYMVPEYYQNTIEGKWTSANSIFTAFLTELELINELTLAIFGDKLFRKDFAEDERPKEFTFFFTPTSKKFEDFILLLDKMISENINKDFFKGKVDLYDLKRVTKLKSEHKAKGTLRLLEEWMKNSFTHEATILNTLKSFQEIRVERQKPAHKISDNQYNKLYTDRQKDVISRAFSSMNSLRKLFQMHPKAPSIKVPDWLEQYKIKVF